MTERPRAAEVGEEDTRAAEQQSEGSRASEGRDAAQEFPLEGHNCQLEQGAAVSARELECPVSALQTPMWYEKHVPPLHKACEKL